MAPRSPRRRALALASLLIPLATLGVVASFAPATAQTSEHIPSYRVAMTVRSDGTLHVVEHITYDFGSNEHHGIFRDIPVKAPYDDRYDRIYEVHVDSVQGSPGTPDKTATSRDGPLLQLKIGDPNTTITGRHSYTITYDVTGALNGFADHVELYWNAIGTEWEVPIDSASATVSVPASIQRVACFAGPLGSSLPCSHAKTAGRTASFKQTSLDPGEGLTVVVGFPKGSVPDPKPILHERWTLARAFSATPATVLPAVALLALAVLAIGRLLWTRGRDVRYVGSPVDATYGSAGGEEQRVPLLEHGATPVEYAPPDGVLAGQVGVLVDESAGPLDVTATIVDLAVRGYIRIEEIPKRWIFGKPDWRLVELKSPDEHLVGYERVLLEELFSIDDPDDDGVGQYAGAPGALAPGEMPPPPDTQALERARSMPHVRLSKLRQHFATQLKKVEDELYDDVTNRKWFAGRPDKVRARWAGWGVALLIAGVVLVFVVSRNTHAGLVALPVPIAGALLMWASHRMPRRTAKGTALVRRIFGFRTYIETAEKQEARFQEQENIFSKYLPYAVVFGCTEKWARAFGQLDQEVRNAGWYVGPDPFTAASLSSSIESFATVAAGTITTSASGSSGFSGGGAGGGGGGGGGGSW